MPWIRASPPLPSGERPLPFPADRPLFPAWLNLPSASPSLPARLELQSRHLHRWSPNPGRDPPSLFSSPAGAPDSHRRGKEGWLSGGNQIFWIRLCVSSMGILASQVSPRSGSTFVADAGRGRREGWDAKGGRSVGLWGVFFGGDLLPCFPLQEWKGGGGRPTDPLQSRAPSTALFRAKEASNPWGEKKSWKKFPGEKIALVPNEEEGFKRRSWLDPGAARWDGGSWCRGGVAGEMKRGRPLRCFF